MKHIILFILVFLSIISHVNAQTQKTVYNAYKLGLSIRDRPSAQASVISKIPYGEKLILVNAYDDTVSLVNEGMTGNWNLVEYKGKKGYVAGMYLLDFPPPAANVKSMIDYLNQLSAPAGAALVVTKGKYGDEIYSQYKKQLYKNGFEYCSAVYYESNYNHYFLLDVTLQQAFIIVRLIPEFKDVFSAADTYPTTSSTVKLTEPYETDKQITVEQLNVPGPPEKIKVSYQQGAVYDFEMFQLNGQLVISFGGGV